MRLDALFVLMEDRTDGEIAFEIFERFLHRHELQIVGPQLGRVVLGEIGAQQITAFASARHAQLVAIEPVAERGALRRHRDIDQAPPRWRFLSCGAELHKQLFAREAHCRELLEARPYPPTRHRLPADPPGRCGTLIILVTPTRARTELHLRPATSSPSDPAAAG
jgi:hypothetical protein